ncbi:MAG: hypothetical protein ACE145_11485 [Terriglobia bacterium]
MISKEISAFFWDVNVDTFDPLLYSQYTLGRLLEYGDEKAVAWMKAHFSGDLIRQAIRTDRRLSRRSANFWALVYGIPSTEVVALS